MKTVMGLRFPKWPALLGQAILTASYALFLFETVELVGYNLLRILFALGTFTMFSLCVLTLVRRFRLRAPGVLAFLFLLWINLLHFRYFGTTLQLGSLYNVGFLPYLTTQIAALARWPDLLFLAAAVVLGRALRVPVVDDRSGARRWAGLLLGLYVSAAVFQYFAETQSTLTLARRYGRGETRWQIYKTLRLGSADHAGSILQFGFLWTYASDLVQLARQSSGPLEEAPSEDLSFGERTSPARNIVAIQVESLDRAIIGHEVHGRPVIPFLNRLAESQLLFTNLFAQHSPSGGTSDGDFAFLASLYPLGYKGSLGARGLERLPSLPRVLAANGYATLGFHAHRGSLYHRKEGYRRLGIERLYFKEEFRIEDPDRWHTLKDRDFFHQVFDKLGQTPEPFFAFVVTLSSHSPFDLLSPGDMIETFNHPLPLARNYFASMRYVDAALEDFVEALAERFPDTVVLIYGDHTSNVQAVGYTATHNRQVQPIAALYLDLQRPAAGRVRRLGSTVDLAPTLLELVGYRVPEFWRGESLVGTGAARGEIHLAGTRYLIDSLGTTRLAADGEGVDVALGFTRRFIR